MGCPGDNICKQCSSIGDNCIACGQPDSSSSSSPPVPPGQGAPSGPGAPGQGAPSGPGAPDQGAPSGPGAPDQGAPSAPGPGAPDQGAPSAPGPGAPDQGAPSAPGGGGGCQTGTAMGCPGDNICKQCRSSGDGCLVCGQPDSSSSSSLLQKDKRQIAELAGWPATFSFLQKLAESQDAGAQFRATFKREMLDLHLHKGFHGAPGPPPYERGARPEPEKVGDLLSFKEVVNQNLHEEAKNSQPTSWEEARSDEFQTTHGQTGVYFGEDGLKIGTYWIAHMASADGNSADYSKPALVLQLHTNEKLVHDKLENIKAKLMINKEEERLNDDGREHTILLVAADAQAAEKNDNLFFERPGKKSSANPNLKRIAKCTELPADPTTFYADPKESSDLGKEVLESLGGMIGSAHHDKNDGGMVDVTWEPPLLKVAPHETKELYAEEIGSKTVELHPDNYQTLSASRCLPPEAHVRMRYVLSPDQNNGQLLTSQAEPNNELEEGVVKITLQSQGKGKVSNIQVNGVDRESCQWDMLECRKRSQDDSLSAMMIISHMKKVLDSGNQVRPREPDSTKTTELTSTPERDLPRKL